MASGLNSPQLQYCYDLVNMREMDYHTLYESENPDALVLAILCDFGGDDPQVVVRLLEKLRNLMGQDEGRLIKCLQMLEILADNRHFNVNIQETYDMLEINIERLPSYQKGLETGIKKGQQRKAADIAQKLLAMNFSPEQIAAITQLPLAEIELLKK